MADFAGAVTAIEQRLTANWTATSLRFENDRDAPVVTNGDGELVPWVHCEIYGTEADIKGAGRPGNHRVVDRGEIVATVFAPQGDGRAVARQHAVAIGEIFRVQEFYRDAPGACVRTWTPQIGRGEQSVSENPNGNWWAVTVTIPFEFIRFA